MAPSASRPPRIRGDTWPRSSSPTTRRARSATRGPRSASTSLPDEGSGLRRPFPAPLVDTVGSSPDGGRPIRSDAPFHPSLATADLARAREWYAEKIGWEPYLEPPGTLVYQVGDSFFSLYESEFAGTAENTVMNWNVSDLKAEVARLRENGVEFEDYDYGDFKTVYGIMTDPSGGMNAWFRDLDGNIVGV